MNDAVTNSVGRPRKYSPETLFQKFEEYTCYIESNPIPVDMSDAILGHNSEIIRQNGDILRLNAEITRQNAELLKIIERLTIYTD